MSKIGSDNVSRYAMICIIYKSYFFNELTFNIVERHSCNFKIIEDYTSDYDILVVVSMNT